MDMGGVFGDWEAVIWAGKVVSGTLEAVSRIGEAVSGAAKAVVWAGEALSCARCTMAQRDFNMGWGSCNISRGGICIWDRGGYSMCTCQGGGVRAGKTVTGMGRSSRAGEDVFGSCFGAQMSMLKQVGNERVKTNWP